MKISRISNEEIVITDDSCKTTIRMDRNEMYEVWEGLLLFLSDDLVPENHLEEIKNTVSLLLELKEKTNNLVNFDLIDDRNGKYFQVEMQFETMYDLYEKFANRLEQRLLCDFGTLADIEKAIENCQDLDSVILLSAWSINKPFYSEKEYENNLDQDDWETMEKAIGRTLEVSQYDDLIVAPLNE